MIRINKKNHPNKDGFFVYLILKKLINFINNCNRIVISDMI
jgi:hypothetical protein